MKTATKSVKSHRNPEPPKALWRILTMCENGQATIKGAAAAIGVSATSLTRWWMQIKRPSRENAKKMIAAAVKLRAASKPHRVTPTKERPANFFGSKI